jgi:hypothetical protein
MDSKSILEMSQGAIMERVNYEMGKVIDNILDPNTKADAKRKLTITMTLTPSADRKTIDVKTVSKATLVATDAVTTGLFITSKPGTGEMVVAEMVPQIPGQMDFGGGVQNEPNILRFDKAKAM